MTILRDVRFYALCALLTIFLLPSISAQTASPFRDLTVGNRFVYFARPRYYEPDKPRPRDTTYRYFEQVMSDTLISNIRYAIVYSSFDRTTRYERANDTAIFVWKNGIETLVHNWNVKNGDSINLSFLGLQYSKRASSVDRGVSQPDGEILTGYSLSPYQYDIYSGFVAVTFRKIFGLTQADIYVVRFRYGLLAAFDRDFQGAIIRGTVIGDTSLRTTVVSVDGSEVPVTTSLANIPNPFTESVNLEYSLASTAQDVELRITSTTGETIATFKQGAKSSGKYAVEWNGKAADGRDVPQGAYIVSLFVNGRKQNDVEVIRVK